MIEGVPVLTEWMLLSEAADAIGVSRQQGWRMAQSGKWKTLRRVGTTTGFYVVSRREVETRLTVRRTVAQLREQPLS